MKGKISMDDEDAKKIGVVALVLALLAIGLAVVAMKVKITEDLDMDNFYIDNTNIVEKEIRIPVSVLGKNPTDPPAIDIYGICHVAEFTVDSDKAYYKINVPSDIVGTTAHIHFHWTRSTTGSDENGKRVNWQLKYLTLKEGQNVNTGETTENIEDVYVDTDTDDQIVYITDEIEMTGLTVNDFLMMGIMAISSSGTDLSKPALLELCINYEVYQVHPPPENREG